MQQNNLITDIKVFNDSIDLDKCVNLLEKISGHKNLRELTFSVKNYYQNVVFSEEAINLMSRKLEKFLKELVLDSPHLEKLNLDFSSSSQKIFNDACLLASATKVLQAVRIPYANVSNQSVLRFIRRCPELREIKLPRGYMNDSVLKELADFCPNLKILHLQLFHCNPNELFGFDAFSYAISKLLNLQDIKLFIEVGIYH